MNIPNYQEFMNPVLQSFAKIKNDARIKDTEDMVADILKISDEEKTLPLKSGKMTIISNRSYWAAFYMTNAGLLERTKRGFYKITEEGSKVLKSGKKINVQFLMQYTSFVEFLNRVGGSSDKEVEDSSEQDPETRAFSAIDEINIILKDTLLEKLRNMDSTRFEYLVKDFMEEMKYGEGTVTQRSNDGGIDVIINEDELGLSKIYLQAKRYAAENSIGRPKLQEFSGAMDNYSTTKGIFITTSSFAATAVEYVKGIESSGKTIILIDGMRLADLMIKNNIGVKLVKGFEVKEIDLSFFE